MTQREELLPCPFCGSQNVEADTYIRDGRMVICFECRASVSRFNPDANSKAIEAWNRRALVASPKREPYGYLFQHEETGLESVVSMQQVEWGFEKLNPRLKKIGPVYLSPPIPTAEEHERGIVAALVKLAEAGIPVDMQELLIKQNALPATLYAYLAASGEDKL